MKKILSIVLSLCMVIMYSMPAFAYSSNDVAKVQLSDQAMAGAVGGTGNVQAQILSSSSGSGYATALVVNNSTLSGCGYALKDGVNSSGVGGTTLVSGTLGAGTSQIVSSAATVGWYTTISVDCSNVGIPVLKASAAAYQN